MKRYFYLLLFSTISLFSTAQSSTELADFYYQKAFELHRKGNLNQAIRYYSLALDNHPNHLKSLYNRGVVYLKNRKYAQAEIDFAKIIRITPNDHETLEHLANAKFYQKNYADAVQIYDRLLVFKPNDNLYSNRGLAKSRMNEPEAAIVDYNHAIERNPYDNDYYANRGDAYTQLKRYDQALQSYNQAAQLNPYDAYVYNNRGNVKTQQKAYEEAVVDYNTAINIQQESQFYTNRAFSMLQLNRYAEAITDARYALQLEANNANAYYALGLAHLRLQEFSQAVPYFDQAIQLQPNDSEFYRDRALAHYYLGNYDYAINDCEQSINIYSEDYSVIHVLESAKQALRQQQMSQPQPQPRNNYSQEKGYPSYSQPQTRSYQNTPRYKQVAYRYTTSQLEEFNRNYIQF
ncbi:MAG: tetratricopeptide repeat protein [Saprospiraceae bacterium]